MNAESFLYENSQFHHYNDHCHLLLFNVRDIKTAMGNKRKKDIVMLLSNRILKLGILKFKQIAEK